ncbi:hypothetical protein ABL78_0368 [Leptomonas seymouri]|uniref:Uncharacterized protein n=1 Tax=Leptomonas seymouri TaxID=5684 RepID=A0A0N1I210_LEPSE|nr:hypothetical protein ABL78_0368 [Leptomonas seymouri]|eukprot:KPI90438.1 hypothetical protein ABL78_0368 [Leptomonas seymouri]
MSCDSKKTCTSEDASLSQFVDPVDILFSEEDDGEDVEPRQGEEVEAKMPSLSAEEVDRLRRLTVESIKEMDSPIECAVLSFFENRIQDCEAALRARMSLDPLSTTGAGLIAFLRCVLSMEQGQADIALGLLTRSSAQATRVMTNDKGVMSRSFARMMQFRKTTKDCWLSASEFRAKTIHAESEALRCFVLVLQQSVPSVLKAGIALNKASSNYKALYAELEQLYQEKYGSKAVSLDSAMSPVTSPNTFKERDASLEMSAAMETLGVDRNSVHCVEFGLGAINLVVSLLPTQVRSMLRFIGVEGNRQYGLRLVRQCFMSNSLLSPFSSALLLALYSFLPSASAFLRESYLPVAFEVRQEVFKKEGTRESLLHLWLDGRIDCLTRSVEMSAEKLKRCLEVASNPQLLSTMPQLRDFVVYDQWTNYAVMHQWKRASRCLEIMSRTSKWANAFYQYTQASCLEMLEHEYAEGISNPEGEADFEVEELRRIVGMDKMRKQHITFCDIASREAVNRTISTLYWEAAQRKPVTLGGKPNRFDQFVIKRMEEIFMLHGVDGSQYAAKKTLADALEPMPAKLRLRNTAPLPAYEMLLLLGVAHKIPSKRKDQMSARIDNYLFNEPAVADTELAAYVERIKNSLSMRQSGSRSSKTAAPEPKRDAVKPSTPLPTNYRVLCLCVYKALLLANSEAKADRKIATEVIAAIRKTPAYKDRSWTLSYAQAFVLYERAYIAYLDEGRDAAESILNSLHKQYDRAHYYMHATIDFKAHLASYELLEQRQNEKTNNGQ